MSTWYADADADGYGDPASALETCTPMEGAVQDGTDCDDGDPTVYPGAPEICDGVDSNCDGRADLGEIGTWYVDSDGDGYGDPDSSEETCDPDPAWIDVGDDCDDTDYAVSPSASEACNDVDDDCDGKVDEDFDEDGDGYGGAYCGGSDCDDANPAINPGAHEVCDDDVDDDCDGEAPPCGFSGETDLADADGKWFASRRDADLARLIEVADLDGDGSNDVLAATFYDDFWAGGGYVLPNPLPGTTDIDSVAWHLAGSTYSTGAGRSIGVADTDGDGYQDVMFGAPYGDEPSAYILLGAITADRSLADADVILVGDKWSWCGHGSDLADVNGDGLGDAVVGCYYDDNGGGAHSGTIAITYGPLTDGLHIPDEADAYLTGGADEAFAGRLVRAGGDFDGDGIGDILLSIYDHTAAPYAGAVLVVLGPVSGTGSLDDAAVKMLGEQPMDIAGSALAMGDIDGDGIADAIVGSRGNAVVSGAGAAYVVAGPASPTVLLSEADAIVRGDAAEQYAGMGLAAGDVEGDGFDDLLVGAPFDDTVDTNAGAAFLFAGPLTGTWTTADAEAVFWGEGLSNGAAQGVAIGDVDGDGWSELLIGAPNAGDSVGEGGALYIQWPVN